MKSIILILFLLLTPSLFAQTFPNGCTAVPVKEHSVILSADKPTVVMMHNISNTDIWISHPVSEPGASAGWSSRLQPGNWSALALNDKSFEIACIESKPGHEQQVPCASVLSICHFLGVKTTEQATSTFWIGENTELNSLNAQIGQRGFVITTNQQ